MQHENTSKFVAELEKSLRDATFVKLTLGNPKGANDNLQKIMIRLIAAKNQTQLSFLSRYETRDVTKNLEIEAGVTAIAELLGTKFYAAHLFTTENDFQLEIGKKNARLNCTKPVFEARPNERHNREKQRLIDQNAVWLRALGITNERGDIRDKQQDKWRQINKFVEIVGGLFDESGLTDHLEIVDMGAGKGYLTFALYDYFNNLRAVNAKITGVETRENLINLGNETAKTCGFDDLKFERGLIHDYILEKTDVLIALHACNTATDDAIFAGIRADAKLIICAPCCHKEIRPQIAVPEMFTNILKHGSLLERESEILTDGLRALLLEKCGYKTKVFEFVSIEHTPKNNLIVGIKREKPVDVSGVIRQIAQIKEFYGIREHRLEKLLA